MRRWIDRWCHRLKHEPGAATAKGRPPEPLGRAATYMRNQAEGGRLDYAALAGRNIPIGSGVTKAACKVLVKQRLCGLGLRWKEAGAVLSVRWLT